VLCLGPVEPTTTGGLKTLQKTEDIRMYYSKKENNLHTTKQGHKNLASGSQCP